MIMEYVPCVLRKMVPETDENFIFHSWLKSMRSTWARGKNFFREIDKDVYYDRQKRVIKNLLETSFCLVAHSPEDIDQIVGYIVFRPSLDDQAIVHYIFVKKVFRGMGIGKLLFTQAKQLCGHESDAPVVATHMTGLYFNTLADRFNLTYDPYFVYGDFLDEIEDNEHVEVDKMWSSN